MVWEWVKSRRDILWFSAMIVGIHISWLELNHDPTINPATEQYHPHHVVRYYQEWKASREKKEEATK